MHRKKFVLFGALAALLFGLAGGALVYHNVSAQAATPTPAGTAVPGGKGQPGMGKMGGRGGFGGGYLEQDLATALGIGLDKLQAAYTTANTEALKEAVSQGLITQAQADQITARGIDQRPLEGYFGRQSGTGTIDYNALLAKALGISVEQLRAAATQAFNTSLDNAVKAGTLTQAQADLEKGRFALAQDTKFQASLKSAYEAAVQQAVTDGVITQAQADQILQNQAGKGFIGGMGGFGGMNGAGGHPGPVPGNFGRGPRGNKGGQAPVQPTAAPGSGF